MDKAKENKPKLITEEEQKHVSGGYGTRGYKYSFRNGNYVFTSEGDMFCIKEDVDTNDDEFYQYGGYLSYAELFL